MKRAIFVVTVLTAVVLTGYAAAALFTFGSTDSTISATKDSLGVDFKGVNVMTSPKAGTLTKVEGHLDGLGAGSGSEKVRAIVYSIDANGNPSAFRGVSSELVVNAGTGAGWKTFTFPTSISIPAGKIGIGYWSGGGTANLIRPSYDTRSATCAIKYNLNQTYSSIGSPSDPFGSPTCGSKNLPWAIRVTADDGVAPPTYPKYGIQDGALINNGTLVGTVRDFYLDEAKASGAKLYRLGFWINGESETDTVINKLNARGLEPLILVGGSVRPPGPTPAATGSLCQAATLRYPAVRLFELWNEPNINGWNGSSYAPHLKACYDAIKAVNATDKLLVGGLAYAYNGTSNQYGPKISPITFMEQLYNAPNGNSFDMANVHAYNDPTSHWTTPGINCHDGGGNIWDQTWGNATYCPTGYIRALMNSRGDTAKEIASTEAGDTLNKPMTEAQQATIVQHALQDTRPVFTLIYSNDDLEAPGYGIHRADKSRRPAFTSMQSVTGGTG